MTLVSKERTQVIHYKDGGIGVIPGNDNPIKEIRGLTFFRLLEGGYATAPDNEGIRKRFPLPEGPDTATLITEQKLPNGSFKELERKIYTNSDNK